MPDIDTTLAIGLSVGFGVLNLLIGITWLTCLHRNRQVKRRQLAGKAGDPIDVEKRPGSLLLKRKRSSRAHPHHPAYIVQPRSHRPDIHIVDVVNTPLTHFEDHDYLARDHFTPPPKPQTKKRRGTKDSFDVDSPFGVGGLKPPAGFVSLRDQCQRSMPVGLKRAGSRDTFDTASIYSTASAPGDMHEQIMLAQPFSRAAMGAYINSPLTPCPAWQKRSESKAAGGGGAMGGNTSSCLSKESITPTYPIATKATLTPHHLDFVDPLAPETYDKTLERRWGAYMPDMQPSLLTPKRPRSASNVTWLSRDQPSLQLSPTSPPPASELLPDHLKLALKPVAPLTLKKKSTVRLYRESTVGQILPSPHSPPPSPSPCRL